MPVYDSTLSEIPTRTRFGGTYSERRGIVRFGIDLFPMALGRVAGGRSCPVFGIPFFHLVHRHHRLSPACDLAVDHTRSGARGTRLYQAPLSRDCAPLSRIADHDPRARSPFRTHESNVRITCGDTLRHLFHARRQ